MKKSNPLKTFNDNYDKKVKKVTEGNKKLVKAQVGLTNVQGPVTEGTAWRSQWSDYWSKAKPSNATGAWSQEYVKKLIDRDRKSSGCIDENDCIRKGIFEDDKKNFRVTDYPEIRPDTNRKGGQTKSKKK